MEARGLTAERHALSAYVSERPSAEEGRGWLTALGLENITAAEYPLEVPTGPGPMLLHRRCRKTFGALPR